jgi:hypothetical protein
LAPASTQRAHAFLGPGFGTPPVAPLAGLQDLHFQFLFGTENGFLKGQMKIVEKVAPRSTCAPSSLRTSKVERKEFLKDIPEGRKDVLETLEAGKTGALEPLVPVLIVEAPFLRIPQNLVGFRRLLELLLRFLVPGIAVRMKLKRQLTVGLLDFFVTGVSRNAEYLVVISLLVHGNSNPTYVCWNEYSLVIGRSRTVTR